MNKPIISSTIVLLLTILSCTFAIAQEGIVKDYETIVDFCFTDSEEITDWRPSDWVIKDGVLRSALANFATAHVPIEPITLGIDTNIIILEAEYRPASLAKTTHFYLGLRDKTRRDGFHALIFNTERNNKYTIHYRESASDIHYLVENPGPADSVTEWTTVRLELHSDGRISIYESGEEVAFCQVLPEDINREYHTITIVNRDADMPYVFRRLTLSCSVME